MIIYKSCTLLDVPNSGRAEKSDKYPKGYPPKVANGDRLKFDEFFRNYVKELEKKKSVIVTGDLNVAHAEIGEPYFPHLLL